MSPDTDDILIVRLHNYVEITQYATCLIDDYGMPFYWAWPCRETSLPDFDLKFNV